MFILCHFIVINHLFIMNLYLQGQNHFLLSYSPGLIFIIRLKQLIIVFRFIVEHISFVSCLYIFHILWGWIKSTVISRFIHAVQWLFSIQQKQSGFLIREFDPRQLHIISAPANEPEIVLERPLKEACCRLSTLLI